MTTKKIYLWISKAKAKDISQRKSHTKVINFIINDKYNGKNTNKTAMLHQSQTFNKSISTNRKCHKITATSLNLDLRLPLRKKTKVISKLQVPKYINYN